MAKAARTQAAIKPLRVDKTWFQQRIQDRDLSQRRLAALMQLNHSALSLLFDGRRDISLSEAAELARLLGVSIEELMRRLGVEVPFLGERGTVPVRATINETGSLTPAKSKGTTPSPIKGSNVQAARFDTAGTELSAMHNWTLFWEPTDRIHEEAIGGLCVVERQGGDQLVRIVNRGSERGTFDLYQLGTLKAAERGIRLRSASPVLWVKT